MATFIANNVIAGRLAWSKVENSKVYAKYVDAALVIIESRGYTIDEDGNCVKADTTTTTAE